MIIVKNSEKHWFEFCIEEKKKSVIGGKQAIKPLKPIPLQWGGKNKGEKQQLLSRQQKNCWQLNNDLSRAIEIWTYQR